MKFFWSIATGFLVGALAACDSSGSKTKSCTFTGENADSGATFVQSKNCVFFTKVEWPDRLKAGQGVDNKAIVTIVKPDGQAPAALSFTEFHPHMPAHGHGTNEDSQQIAARADQSNVFDVTGIMFVMAGEATTWVSDVVATVDGQQDVAEVPISRDVE